MPVARDFDDGTPSRRERVLAVRRVWRDLERIAAQFRENRSAVMAVNVPQLARDLEELIAALDRRLPAVAQAGEVGIARDAAALRAKAVERLEQLHYPAPARMLR